MSRRRSKLRRRLLYTVGAAVGLLLVLEGALRLIDFSAYKTELERAASQAIGMEVRVGRIGMGLLTGLHFTLEDLRVRNRGTELASANEARVGIDLLPLLYKQIRIAGVRISRPRIYVEQDRGGQYNFQTSKKSEGTLPALEVANVKLTDGTLLYRNAGTGDEFEAGDCDLELHRLQLAGDGGPGVWANLSFIAQCSCNKARRNNFAIADFEAFIAATHGVLTADPVTMRVFGGRGSGSLRADLAGPPFRIDIRYALSQFRAEELLKALSADKTAQGTADFSANITLEGNGANELKRSARGEISLRGNKLTLRGTDIDKALARLESSQSFNLVDTGAFFFAGPLGLIATRGVSLASVVTRSSGDTAVEKLVSDWDVRQSVAHAKDVAMATKENRIALTGRLDFTREHFDDVTVAVIDAKGCAKLKQTISGPFRSPSIDTPGVLASLAAPVVRLFKKVKGGSCPVFYAGSVPPPN